MLEAGDLDGYAAWKWRSYKGRSLSRARRFTDRPAPAGPFSCVGARMSALGGKADIIFGRLDVCL